MARMDYRCNLALALLAVLSSTLWADDSSRLDAERAYGDLRTLTRIGEHRRTGSENESKTIAFLETQLENAGLEPVRDSFETDIFEYDEAWVQVKDRGSIWRPACFPLYYTGTTGARPRTAEAVYLDIAKPENMKGMDLAGKIAVFELLGSSFTDALQFFPPDVRSDFVDRIEPIPTNIRKTYDHLVQSGAAGVIAVVTFSFRNAHYGMNTFEFDGQMKVPGLMVRADDGARLIRLIRKNPGLPVTIKLDARLKRRKICNLMAEIPGQRPDVIVLSAAHTAWFKGGVERAGSAGVLEMARHFNNIPIEKRRNTLLILYSTGHEIEWAGIQHFFGTQKDYVDRTIAFINMGSSFAGDDWIKVDGQWRDSGRVIPRFAFVSPNSHMREIADHAIRDNGLDRVLVFSTDVHNTGQGRFAKELRIPAFTLLSSPPYYHSSKDLIDNLDVKDYRCALDAYRQIVATLLMEDGDALKQLEKHKGDD